LIPAGATRPPLAQPTLCLITDRSLAKHRPLEQLIAEAVAGGVTMVQIREKDLPGDELLDLACRVRDAVGHEATLVINARVEVAVAAGAAGVHLPSDWLATDFARQAVEPAILVGRSVHSLEEVARAVGEGVDYIELGTIFPSPSHPGGLTQGLEPVRAAASTGMPILAVGGITAANAADVIAAGASGVAVISAILAAPEPRLAARRLMDVLRDAWARRPAPTRAAAF
jgi:thiamine-phosphate pyrophosphorylase